MAARAGSSSQRRAQLCIATIFQREQFHPPSSPRPSKLSEAFHATPIYDCIPHGHAAAALNPLCRRIDVQETRSSPTSSSGGDSESKA